MAARSDLPQVEVALSGLARDRRVVEVRLAGEGRWIAIEDVARFRDAFGASPPPGVAETWLQAADRDDAPPLDALLLRWARTHSPFTADAPAGRWGIAPSRVQERLRALVEQGVAAGGRLPARRHGARVRRSRRAARPSPSLAGAPATRSRARPRRCLRPLPACPGTASARGRPGTTGCWRWSASWRATRCLPPSWSGTSCRPACATTPRACWTSSARLARWYGSAADRWAGTTAAWRCIAAIVPSCWPRPAPSRLGSGRRARCTTPSVSTSSAAAPPSSAACAWRSPTPAMTKSCSMRCGTSSGRVRSPTTPSPRCGRCRSRARGRARRGLAGRPAWGRRALPGAGR